DVERPAAQVDRRAIGQQAATGGQETPAAECEFASVCLCPFGHATALSLSPFQDFSASRTRTPRTFRGDRRHFPRACRRNRTPAETKERNMSLRINAEAPNFTADTTQGP